MPKIIFLPKTDKGAIDMIFNACNGIGKPMSKNEIRRLFNQGAIKIYYQKKFVPVFLNNFYEKAITPNH